MSSSSSSSTTTINGTIVTSFIAGMVTMYLVKKMIIDTKQQTMTKDRTNAGATIEGNDLSLFYGDIKELTTITKERKFLPKEIYAKLVNDCVVCCVDCLLVRVNKQEQDSSNGTTNWKKECLLVKRTSEPVKGVWWLPGGRLWKGETFFDAAIRKAKEETGLSNVKPIQVLGVWNTLFPTSHWDNEISKGTQTVNPIVLVELPSLSTTPQVVLDETSEESKWIPLDPNVAMKNNEDKYVIQALLRLQAWDPTYSTKF